MDWLFTSLAWQAITSNAGIQLVYMGLAVVTLVLAGDKIMIYLLARNHLMVEHKGHLIFDAIAKGVLFLIFLAYIGVTGTQPKLDRLTWTPIIRALFFCLLWPEAYYAVSLTVSIFKLMWRNRRVN